MRKPNNDETLTNQSMMNLLLEHTKEFRGSSATAGFGPISEEHIQIASGTLIEFIGANAYFVTRKELDELIQENIRLRQDIHNLLNKLNELITFFKEDYISRAENLIVLSEIPREQAKKEIAELFQKSELLYYSDIAERLRLDLELVVELCSELERDGKIKPRQ